jgi:hypothetical protein
MLTQFKGFKTFKTMKKIEKFNPSKEDYKRIGKILSESFTDKISIIIDAETKIRGTKNL